MSSISKQTRQASINRNEMHRSWEAAEWLIRGKVEQLDYLLYKVHSEARTLGVEGCYIREYVKEKMVSMINEVAEEREYEERQGARARKKIE